MKRFTATALSLALAASAAACSDRIPSAPDGNRSVPEGTSQPPSGLVVSNARSAVAYLSAVPGTFQTNAVSAVARNVTRAGAPRQFQVIDGGFDPIGIDAQLGDEVSLTISVEGGGVWPSIAVKVPARRALTVVRTNPSKLRNYIPIALNVPVSVVFSEPVDKSSLTPFSVALHQNANAVNGSVRVSPDGLSAEFIPDSPLQLETSYSLVIDQGIRDLDGDALGDAYTVTFITEPPAPLGQLLFTRLSDRQIYRVNADGTSLTWLTSSGNNERPAWSPDGRKIAFARWHRDSGNSISDIYVMDADGSNIVRRTVGSGFESAAWSPDGRKLAVSDEGVYYAEIHVISADDEGASPTLLARDARSPAWSPDGKEIAFVRTSGDDGYHHIVRMNADGTGAHKLTEIDPGGIYGLAWSPDGQRIAYSKCVDGGCDIYVMGAGGGGGSRITNVGNAQWAAWSPDGKWIAITLSSHSGREWHPSVAYVSAQGGTPRVIVTDGFNPSWQP